MIVLDCSDAISYQKKFYKNKTKKKFIIFVLLFFFVVFLVINFVSKIVNPIILSYGEIETKRLITTSSNEAISEIAVSIAYDQLINISYNSDGSISLIKANTEQINKISNILAQKTQSLIDNTAKLGFKIPIGTLSGIGFLAGKGSKINFYFSPIGSVLCHFYTEFSSVGINQTSHKIFVNIETSCSLILPFKTKNFEVKADYLLTECIIIGKVPNTYLNGLNLNAIT